MISSVFIEFQDVDANGKPKYPGAHMLRWAQNEPGEFYRLAARLIPTELQRTAPIAVRIVKFADLPDSDEIEGWANS